MKRVELKCEHGSARSCAILESIEGDYRDSVSSNPHLFNYLHDWARERPLPDFAVQLSREMRKLKDLNLIYPVGDPIFIHVFVKQRGERPLYHPIQPVIPDEVSEVLELVEEAIALKIDEKEEFEDDEEKKKVLFDALDKAVRIDNALPDHEYRIKREDGFVDQVTVNEYMYNALKYKLEIEKVGLGILEPMIRDPYIEDISCDGVGPIFVEHKVFKSLQSTIEFKDPKELDEFTIRLSERVGRPVTHKKPIVDATLPDGSRLNIVFSRDISKKGSNFTIRKFSGTPLSIVQLVSWNTMSAEAAAYIWMILETGLSLWVSGETASGKTTTLNAICTFIRPDAKIISIEDTAEVMVPHENWVREITRESESKEASIGAYELLKAALRQRPNYIIVGEIRGREGNVAFQAMQTGHPVLSTFHAASVEKLIQRITGHPIDVPKSYIDNLNVVVIQSAVRLPQTGMIERRVLSINEIVGYDPKEGSFSYIETFHWDPKEDRHIFRGEGNSYIFESKIAVFRGYSKREMRALYDEMFERAELIRELVKAKITNYWDVWKVMKLAYDIGYREVLRMLKEGEDVIPK